MIESSSDWSQLPPELLQLIEAGSDEQFLETLTRTAVDARFTHALLARYEDVFAHVCASLQRPGGASFAAALATLGRIIPHAPLFSRFAIDLLQGESHSIDNNAQNGDENLLYLLGLFRLLHFDPRTFRKFVRAQELSLLLGRVSRPATYLIIRILQIHLEAADHWFESTFKRYLENDTQDGDITGLWDEKLIDYRFLSLWEEDRYAIVRQMMTTGPKQVRDVRRIPRKLFHPSTALVGDVLLPRDAHAGSPASNESDLVETETVATNLQTIAQALKSTSPILLQGLAGSGKTLLAQHVARSLGKLEKMVALHLNEQSDAKLLLGVYTTGETPGSFMWKPGVLTTAVQEGRWVLIEDLDRAPNEVLGTLLPIIEKRQLLIPNRRETIYAAEGFRIIATVRTSMNHRGEETKPLTHMLGFRHWQNVSMNMPPVAEQSQIAQSLFPKLGKLLPQFMIVYERLIAARQRSQGQSKTGVARSISPRDLLKWCRRVSSLMESKSSFTSSDMDAIYLEALDCFVGALPDDGVRTDLAAIVAEELRIDPQRRDHLLTAREVQYEADKSKLVIGRYSLPKAKHVKVKQDTFSTNPHTARMLERVTAGVLNREPLLLVGETGVGKTTAVQHLANHLGKKLVPFNLSQQSEAGDLLGGFKPVNARTLMVPLKDDFDDLFAEGFSLSKNKQFLDLLGKQMAKSNWKGACKLFRQALGMVNQQRAASPPRDGEAPSKKRKVDTKRAIDFARWDAFAEKLQKLERQLASGDDAFAFTFVEGNIVKALRNGDWVLLDEINLASSDTLESVADLLDSNSPSLLLTEAGNIERIDAHPEFRVFAAMNPATDVGKKDLPPGIRSRFTELYVDSPDKDLKSLQSIVRAYLRQEAVADTAVATDVSVLYQKIITLAEQNKLVDGAGQRPHFSLRTLTRTLSYAKHIQQMCSLRRALYEGFQMSFMTFLDVESSAVVQPFIQQHLFGKRTNVSSELKKALRKPNDNLSYVQGHPRSKHWIRQGTRELQEESHYIITPFVESNLENLVRAASTRQFPVLIQGPTSSGKTSMIEYLAKRTGHVFTRINNHEHTDLQEYLGTYISGTDGRLQFQEGVLVKALREGHWIVLDELNLAPTDVLEALNRLLDDNRELLVPETQEVIRPHPDFMLFATQNPAGLYGGRKTLSRAFRNRFLELHFDDIPVDELQEILQRRTQLPKTWCERIVAVYNDLSNLRQQNRLFEQKSFATLRDLFRWALRPNETIEQLAANGYMLLCERVRKPEERAALKEVIEQVMSKKAQRVRVDEDALYSDECNEVLQHKQNARGQGAVWTKAMRRLYVLVSRAIQNNEPVLLVGETGCGKTTVCQMLAEALTNDLHTVNAHQNTETGDLIGSQRPVRNRSAIEADLRTKLLASPALQALEDRQTLPTEDLLNAYDKSVSALNKESRVEYTQSTEHVELQATRIRFKALFEWVDGSLVQAMRNGDFFLLDEISLADDSVLERINSVLESQRTIMLAEKGSLDSFVTAAPGFQFFATMNPGGDYGKRELSPALRDRFTEIWVPALSDTEDVLQIVRAKLVPAAHPYASSMVDFAVWFKARFDTSASSSVSIRDTLAWVEFVNASEQDVIAAVVHGAAMVYIDTLGANPAGLMSITSNNLEEERNVCLAQLGHQLKVNVMEIYGQGLGVDSDDSRFAIGPFGIARTPTQCSDSGFTFEPHMTRSNAMRVLRALQLTKPILLEGSPGVGKTALVTAVASAAGMPLTRINLSDQTDLLDLFGSDAPVEGAQTGTFVWRDAPFLRAMKNGEWVLLDEMNLASQSVLEGLNACLDHRGEVFVPELGQSFSRHPDFRLFAAQNPHHQGGGRKGLPASFVNRFTVVYADSFRGEDLVLICQRMFQRLPEEYIQKTVAFMMRLNEEVAVRRAFGSNGGPWEFNLRDTARWLDLASTEGGLLKSATARDFAIMLCTQRFRTPYDRSCVETIFDSVFDPAMPTADLFSGVSSGTLQAGLAVLPRDVLCSAPRPLHEDVGGSWNQLRILQSLMLSVGRSWPVLLTGPAGVGKTTMIERLASGVGANVVTLAMSAETDALDLIGGYEQFDPTRHSSQALSTIRARVESMSKKGLAEESLQSSADLLGCLEGLQARPRELGVLQKLVQSLPAESTRDLLPLLESLRSTSQFIDKARFEWIDGPLIEALQQGKWLVLDNANLCSPSVLDRLNSLLEPNGVLIVNEHCGEDGTPRVIRPHSNFRIFLTMDPRLGELSRAMRNRAVELYIDTLASQAASSTDGLYTESATARFRALKAAGTCQKDRSETTSLVAIEHLALDDRSLISRFRRQLEIGLFEGHTIPAQSFENVAPTLDRESHLRTFYEEISTQVPADFACVQVSRPAPAVSILTADGKDFLQTLHPLNNQPLVQQSLSRAIPLAAQHDFGMDLSAIAKTFANLKADRKLSERLSRLSKSFRDASGTSQARGGSTQWAVVERMLRCVQQAVQQLNANTTDLTSIKATLRALFAFISMLLQGLALENVDFSLLTAYTLVGRALISARGPQLLQMDSALLDLVPPSGTGSSGSGFTSLWKHFKPSMPATGDELQAMTNFESVVGRFDRMVSGFRLPLQRLVELRMAFWHALRLRSVSAADLNTLSENIIASTPEMMANEETGEVLSANPHFAQSFEYICQHFAVMSLKAPCLPQRNAIRLEILAKRKTVQGMDCSQDVAQHSPQQRLRLLGLSMPASEDDQAQDPGAGICHSALKSLLTTEEVSLQSLSLLEAETAALGQAVASKANLIQADSLDALDHCLRGLLREVLQSLTETDVSTLRDFATLLGQALDDSTRLVDLQVEDPGAQYRSVATRLWGVGQYLQSTRSSLEASRAWSSLAVACLELFIPERAFDPVQEAEIRRAVHKRAKGDAESQLSALRDFRQAWTGESDSLRARVLEEDVAALGPEPASIQLWRPETSRLSQLFNEFQALMRILQPLRQSNGPLADSSTWGNLMVIRSRLKEQYRPYADLTTPVVGFIDCLAVARRLALRAEAGETISQGSSIATITPFADASLPDFLSDERFLEIHQHCKSKELQLYWLSAIASRTSIMQSTSHAVRSVTNNTFRNFYEAWKTELDRGQRLAAANSSLYKYRGGDDFQEEATQEELDELFPDFDGQSEGSQQTNGKQSVQDLAPRMAELYHLIHSPNEPSGDQFGDLLRQWSAITAQWQPGSDSSPIPTVLCMLNDLSIRLSSKETPRTANIYKDSNVAQSRVLVALVERIQVRFRSIHDTWPEHATPIEVLRCCDQILALGHSEPLARYLPVVEKLHATINEWQKVASSEYSAASVLEETTSLIIAWRQLELSTWAGMFNLEDEQCKRSAASWWYIAYETIICASEESVNGDNEALKKFATQLVETLGGFLANCGLGEYNLRLSMLADFEAALGIQEGFSVVRNALASLISFYSRFGSAVRDQLATKRAALEKDIKNVIQVASWKDRNIETLKNSAKASHRKLFRTVKKYRQLLSQPVGPLLQNEFAASTRHAEDMTRAGQLVATGIKKLVDKDLLSITDLPAYFQDPIAAAHEFETKTASFTLPSPATTRIEKFLRELDEESTELRKATPSIAKDENKTLVQHLKTRKRRLLADVLKDVRLMGFQTNISDDVLAQQSTLHTVLAQSPPLALHKESEATSAADEQFHRLVYIMPSVRESAVKHSEDLTPAEIARSKTLLESMLQVSIEQRSTLDGQSKNIAAFRASMQQLVAFCDSESPCIRAHPSEPAKHLRVMLNATRPALQTATRCIEIQANFSGNSYSGTLDAFGRHVNQLDTIRHTLDMMPTLPPGIVNAGLAALEQQHTNTLNEVNNVVSESAEAHPELGPTLNQLSRWTQTENFSSNADGGDSVNKPWLQGFLGLVDQLKNLATNMGPNAVNGQPKKAWLLEHQSWTSSNIQGLQLGNVGQSLGQLLNELHSNIGTEHTMAQVANTTRQIYPVLNSYADLSERLLLDLCSLHSATCKMAHRLAVTFVQLAREGFCQPPEKEQSDEKDSGQVESGTGLGDGEGGEDISKDVGDDEDLGDLAQDADSKDKQEETEAEKDAVDMADEELEGKFDESAEAEDDEAGEDDDGKSDAEVDEEAGKVDEKDGGSDEKTWDDGKVDEAEKEADKGKGTRSEDIGASTEDGAKEETEEMPQDGEQEEEQADGGAELDDETEHREPEQADPHLQEEQNLDLPDDMNMDGDKADDDDAGSDFPDDLSQMDADEPNDPDAGQADSKDVDMDEEDETQAEDNGEAAALEQEDQPENEQDEDAGSDVNMLDRPEDEQQPDDGITSADAGHGNEEEENAAQSRGALQNNEQFENENDTDQDNVQPGTSEGGKKSQQNASTGRAEVGGDEQHTQSNKQLGDVLNHFIDQHRDIEEAKEDEEEEAEPREEMDLHDARFEHTDQADAEMQALAAASAEQSRALDDQKAIPIEQEEDPDQAQKLENNGEDAAEDAEADEDTEGAGATDRGADAGAKPDKALIGQPTDVDMTMDDATYDQSPDEDMDNVDEKLTNTHLSLDGPEYMSLEDARQIWAEHESKTRNMAVVLTEHLRLILQPTQATKMRGDFRTGKRLNIKKIIPYIASSYKRDKIWMRRSIPSKRSYQIMLAIDDSQSMNESERKNLAFDTLALVAKSMSMLEVGELCIVGFGQTINVNHDFSAPFTSEAGAEVFKQFSFSQSKTDVRKLLEKSIDLFRTARLKTTGSASDLWQLQLIISDGLCEDHASIRQLVRQAHEEQIMVVFVIVDSMASETTAAESSQQQSIMDLQEAKFGKDANGDLTAYTVKYMDTFPFRYYLIVRDVVELPGVLAGALRQWFAEVVESG